MSRLCYEEVNLAELFKIYYRVERLDTQKNQILQTINIIQRRDNKALFSVVEMNECDRL